MTSTGAEGSCESRGTHNPCWSPVLVERVVAVDEAPRAGDLEGLVRVTMVLGEVGGAPLRRARRNGQWPLAGVQVWSGAPPAQVAGEGKCAAGRDACEGRARFFLARGERRNDWLF